jgi:hypothetical protein
MAPTDDTTPGPAPAPATARTEKAVEKKANAAQTEKGTFQQQRRTFKSKSTTPSTQQTAGAPPKEPRFDGRCPRLADHIYDCTNTRQADIYAKTTREVAEYVGRTYKYGTDVKIAVETLKLPTLKLPADPVTGANASEKRVWEKRIDEYVKRKITLEENMKTLYTLIWGQCTDPMRARLESKTTHAAIYNDYNSLELLKSLKASVYNFQGLKYLPQALHESK